MIGLAPLTRAATLLAGARTWSVAVLVVAGGLGLRAHDRLGDEALVWLCGSALTAVAGRAVSRDRKPASTSSSDTPTPPGVR
jgi:hypothetical protein